jgi:DNA modification methylase
MRGSKAKLVIADPPYNVKIDGHVSGLGAVKHREFPMASGEMSETEYVEWLESIWQPMVENVLPGTVIYAFNDWRHLIEAQTTLEAAGCELLNLCVWVKDNGGMGSLYRSQHELIFVAKVKGAPHRNNIKLGSNGRYRTNVWEYPGANSFSRATDEGNLAVLHPTVKPVDLIADAILDCSARGDIVLDPFLGSGSTVIACEKTGRGCYGIELDPLYVDTIVRRWQRYTGKEALHAESDRSFNEIATEVTHG